MLTRLAAALAVACALAGSAQAETLVPLIAGQGGSLRVPVQINGRLTIEFVLDSGSSDVSLPADIVRTLIRTGTATGADLVGDARYRYANGSEDTSARFVIHSLKVGGVTVTNVVGSISSSAGSPLLGQTFLKRFRSWSVDNQRQALVLGDSVGAPSIAKTKARPAAPEIYAAKSRRVPGFDMARCLKVAEPIWPRPEERQAACNDMAVGE